ncbi:hypothetical protein EV702DRAFT_1138318 [Suillus placidus]|uniref:Uncharacterized protein n=1 Tax=Suillus placidus TaxID=48579 RepID=A0A9P6ZL63_9AGAM|nr:hypothetical protein EV702DRAFT_1138318 [Suillus placidus]
MTTNTPPSVILTDALASLNKAVNIAFTSIQDQSRQEVTQASAETREARRERDEAVKALHELRLEEQVWKQEAGARQSAVEQAELTIKHHAETIAQLRYESEQWKQQCLRLEDTSRQEATSWKEQFLRVEQERHKLATRVDELMEEQLSQTVQTHASITPFTTMLRYPNTTASTSLSNPPASTRHRFPPYTSELPDESISTSLSRAPKPISANCRASGDKSKQYLIRRVQAVIEVPVKEESVENTISDEAPSASSSSTSSSSSSSSGSASRVPGSSRPTSAISSKTIPKPSKPTSAPRKTAQGTNKVVSATSKSASLNNKPTSAASTKSAPPPSKSTARPSKPTLSVTSNKPLSNPATSKPTSSSRPARKTSIKRQYVEIDENEDGEDKMSEQYKSGSDATAEDEVDSSEEEEDELTLGAEENRREVYGTKRIADTSSMKALSQAPAKKRKLISSTTAIITGSGKKPPAKGARG